MRSKKNGVLSQFDFSPRLQEESFGFAYNGFVNAPENGAYRFYTSSDDGSQLFINDQLVVDNDGLHGMIEKDGLVALAKGYHKIRVTYFEKSGGDGLTVSWKGPGIEKSEIPDSALYHK